VVERDSMGRGIRWIFPVTAVSAVALAKSGWDRKITGAEDARVPAGSESVFQDSRLRETAISAEGPVLYSYRQSEVKRGEITLGTNNNIHTGSL
jgi:hypothetical protein